MFLRFCITIYLLSSVYFGYATGVFDAVKTVPVKERMAKALFIYDEQVKRKDSAYAITAIQQLVETAVTLNDAALHCFSLSLLADQYARIRSFNAYSTELHLSAIALAKKNRLPLLMGICNYRMGGYYYSFKRYPLAFEYLLRADTYFQEMGYKEVPDIDKILFFIGGIYYETGNYDKAKGYLLQMQQLSSVRNYLRKQSLNTLAMIDQHNNDTSGALNWFQKTLQEAIRQNDSTWIGISYSNIGNLYFSNGQYNKAYPLLQNGSRLASQHALPEDAASGLLLLARIDLLQNNIASAGEKINEAVALVKNIFTLTGKKNLYEAQALYYEKINQPAKALSLQRQLVLVNDSLVMSRDRQAYEKIQLRIETEKYLNELVRLEAEATASAVQRNTVIAVLFLSLVVILLLYGRHRLKAKNAAAVLLAEKSMAEEKLQHARQLLQDFTRNNRQKNELIEQFAAELDRLKSNMTDHPLYEERLKNFEKLIQSTLLTDAEWLAFRELFDKVHKGFFIRLAQKLPDLSIEDTRLLSLLRLGLGTAEMARMMGMDVAAVGASILRLRNHIHPAQDGIQLSDLVQAI